MAVDSFARRLAAAAIQKGGSDVTKEYVDAELDKKYDKTGGPITGDVAITGNLTVSGTTTTEKEKQLLVEDNVIATNANKVDLQTLLSGLAINKNANATYGIMYDPTDDTVKFGEGTLDENNKFVFKDGEGHPLAIRADSSQFSDGYLVKWDEDTMSFVQADLQADNVSKKIDKIDFSNGQATVTFDTADGMTVGGTGMLTYADQSTHQVATDIEIPIVPGNGVIMDATTSANHVTVKVDPEHSVYMANTPEAENAVPVYAKSSKSWVGLTATPSATASSVVTRDASGRMQAGAPANDGDVAIKSYVDAAVGEKQDALTAGTGIDITDNTVAVDTDLVVTAPVKVQNAVLYWTGTEWGRKYLSEDYTGGTIPLRTASGQISGGTPTANSHLTTKKYVDDSIAISSIEGTAPITATIDENKKATIGVDDIVARLDKIPTTGGWIVPTYNVGTKSWHGELAYSSAAAASTYVVRDSNGVIVTGTPTAENHATTKKYVDDSVGEKQNVLTAGTGISIDSDTVKISDNVSRTSTTDMGVWIPVQTRPAGPPTWSDVPVGTDEATASSIVRRTAAGQIYTASPTANGHAATKAYVDAAIVAEGPASTIVTLSAPDEAVNGILTEDELAKLQASDNASIMFSHKKYDLGGKGHQEGYLTYTHAGYENNVHILESITITISTRAWVLNATDVLDEDEIKEAVAPMIPAAPTWKTTAPTTDADKAKVQFTKVTITTADSTHFPGMNGRYTVVPGFTDDGFQFATVVCMQEDPAYEFPYIGSITSTMASGIVIRASVAPAYVSIADPEVTFAYEYLW